MDTTKIERDNAKTALMEALKTRASVQKRELTKKPQNGVRQKGKLKSSTVTKN